MRLTINLITYNSAKYLPALFGSLKKQTFKDWDMNVLDNNSSEDSVLELKKELARFGGQFRFIENKINIGFAVGHNELFKKVNSEYFLILNDDVVLTDDCLQKMIDFLDQHKNAAAVSPRLMRLKNRDVIDSLGLKVFRNRRVVEIDGGVVYAPIYNNTVEVFGLSCACAMFKKSIIENVCYTKYEMFDRDYFMYKEDIDLAYRLQQADFRLYTLMDAICYHDRTGVGGKDLSEVESIKNKRKQSQFIKYYSYKNHLATLYKNEYWQNYLLDWPWIKWYELKKLIYYVLFDRTVLKGVCDLWRDRLNLKRKRKMIIKLRKINWKEMRKRIYA